jgi:hypothetical protein
MERIESIVYQLPLASLSRDTMWQSQFATSHLSRFRSLLGVRFCIKDELPGGSNDDPT